MCVLVSAKLCVRTRARVCTFARQCGMCVCVCVRVSQLVRGMQRVYECKGVWESGNSKPRYSAPSSYGRQLETAAWNTGYGIESGRVRISNLVHATACQPGRAQA